MGQKKPKIILHNQEYLLKKCNKDETYWICNQYFHPKTDVRCKVRVCTKGKIAVVFGEHTHEAKFKQLRPDMRCQKVRIKYEKTF